MATLRTGRFGNYYGSALNESSPLSISEMTTNASYIYSYLTNSGWKIQAIAAMLGNMQAESTINPGRWQSEAVNNTSLGYGLVQWTPATKYFNWCGEQGLSDYSEMDNNLARIIYEVSNAIQWIPTNTYDFSFSEFTQSDLTVSELAKSFLLNYERPADQSESVQEYRASLAENWYLILTGETPSEPSTPGIDTTASKRRKYNFLILNANRRRKTWTK